jgi:hypothetical protein
VHFFFVRFRVDFFLVIGEGGRGNHNSSTSISVSYFVDDRTAKRNDILLRSSRTDKKKVTGKNERQDRGSQQESR